MKSFIILLSLFSIIFAVNIDAAVRHLIKNSHAKTTGWCARYVANALEKGEFKFTRQERAYMYHSNRILIGMGYNEISKPISFEKGDITVTEANEQHEHGHIAMYTGTQWISDFRQKSEFIYSSNQPPIHYYRYGGKSSNGVPKYTTKTYTTSDRGINLIKYYESCKLKAYRDEYGKVWTIGYGHTGKDVYEGLVITKERAEELLRQDLKEKEKYVNNKNYVTPVLNQNQFDALVSFTYNVGQKNLKELCYGKTLDQIANKITLYNKSRGTVLPGLVKRRQAEKELFLDSTCPTPIIIENKLKFTYQVKISTGRILGEIENDSDYAGIVGYPIVGIAIKVNRGTIKYRVHVKGGRWLGFISGFDWKDYKKGYAGNGKPIDLVQIIHDSEEPKYRVSPVNRKYYGWQLGNRQGKGYDGYAGKKGVKIDRIQIAPSN